MARNLTDRLPGTDEFNAMFRDWFKMRRVQAEMESDPMNAYAPSDCWDLINRSVSRMEKAILEKYNKTQDEFADEINKRGYAKWAWVRGI